jgi:hypothetical protein
VHTAGPLYEQVLAWYGRPASAPPAQALVVIDVERAEELVSPAYDDGTPEDVVAQRWRLRHLAI